MRYVNIPIGDKEYPKAEQVSQFLKLTERSRRRASFTCTAPAAGTVQV